MATTTLAAILERIETVLQDAPLSLKLSVQPFGDETVPGIGVDETFRVVGAGNASKTSQSNYSEARVDRVCVTLQQTMKLDGYTAQRNVLDLCDDVVRAVIADGPNNGYDATEEKGSRKVVNPKETDICRAEIHFLCDYDWSEA